MAERGERNAWLALATIDGVGPETFSALLARYGNASAVLAAASSGEVRRWLRSNDEGRPLMRRRTLMDLESAAEVDTGGLAEITARGLWTLTPLDRDYPPRLHDLNPPPPLLVGRGDSALLRSGRMTAVVGTRRPTPSGRLLAARIAGRLAECEAVVVSGLALGIDGAAHAATVERGGRTAAVIGGGHDHPGPAAHAGLRRRIIETGGVIVSEYPPAVRPTQGTYPRRNRIIAALAEATIVIEAPLRSGALITARIALELGRPVLVAPGRIGDWATAGSITLLHDDPAVIIADLDRMTDDLGYLGRAQAAAHEHRDPPADGVRRQAALELLSGPERAVAERVCRAPSSLDTLVDDTGLEPAVVSSAVTLLLMRGWLQPVGAAYLPAGPLLS